MSLMAGDNDLTENTLLGFIYVIPLAMSFYNIGGIFISKKVNGTLLKRITLR